MRDINLYTEKYHERSFGVYQARYRRKKIIEEIEKYKPQAILEIGCGDYPLFTDVGGAFTIVEPSDDFASNAIELSKQNQTPVKVINDFFEESIDQLERYDMIICASLLHEVENPEDFLKKLFSICDKNTLVHINVPNALSMHRILAVESGLMPSIYDLSDRNIKLQQHSVFDIHSLTDMVRAAGGQVIDSGSIFIKPFTHAQMMRLLDCDIISEKVLDGFYNLVKYMPELGSEIYVTCRKDN